MKPTADKDNNTNFEKFNFIFICTVQIVQSDNQGSRRNQLCFSQILYSFEIRDPDGIKYVFLRFSIVLKRKSGWSVKIYLFGFALK